MGGINPEGRKPADFEEPVPITQDVALKPVELAPKETKTKSGGVNQNGRTGGRLTSKAIDYSKMAADGFTAATVEQVEKWKDLGEIGPVEYYKRYYKGTTIVPFLNAEQIAGDYKMYDLAQKYHTNDYGPDETAQKTKDYETLKAYQLLQEELMVRGTAVMSDIVEGGSQSVALAGEFTLGLGVGGAMFKTGAVAAKKAAQVGVKMMIKKALAGGIRKSIGRGAKGLGKAALKTAGFTAAVTPHRVYAGYKETQLNDYMVATDKGAHILEEMDKNPTMAMFRAFQDVWIENLVEVSGGKLIGSVTGATRTSIAHRMAPKTVEAMKKFMGKTRLDKLFAVDPTDRRRVFNGFIEELGEERMGAFIRNHTGLEGEDLEGATRWEKTVGALIPTWREFLVEAGVITMFGTASVSKRALTEKWKQRGMSDTEIELRHKGMSELDIVGALSKEIEKEEAKGKLVNSVRLEKLKKGFNTSYQKLSNRFASIENLSKLAKDAGIELKEGDDPLILARQYLSIGRMVKATLEQGTYRINKDGSVEETGEGLKPILDSFDVDTLDIEADTDTRHQDLQDYMIARRYLEDLVPREDVEVSDAQKTKAVDDIFRIEQKYGDKLAKLQETTERLYGFQSRVLENLVESGQMTQEQYDKILSNNKHYIPFDRILPEDEGSSEAVKKAFTKAKSPIKKIKGSELEIENIYSSMVKNTINIMERAHRNKVAKAVAQFADLLPSQVREVELPQEFKDLEEAADRVEEGFDTDGGIKENGKDDTLETDTGGRSGGRENISGQMAVTPFTESLQGSPKSDREYSQDIRQNSQEYASENGLDPTPLKEYVVAEAERGTKIAEEYENGVHDPNNPEVKAAYDALIQETLAQYQHLKKLGYTFEMIPEGQNPYPKGPREALADMRDNKHLWVYPSDSGFGTETDGTGHPLLQSTEEYIGDHQLLANDVFRIVHDVYGHAKDGNGFGKNGEETAFQNHVRMYSPLAARAMATETRGQNSWVNFGPQAEHNRANPAETIYAEQKAFLMPEWVMTENLKGKSSFEIKDGIIYKTVANQTFAITEQLPTEKIAGPLDEYVWIDPKMSAEHKAIAQAYVSYGNKHYAELEKAYIERIKIEFNGADNVASGDEAKFVFPAVSDGNSGLMAIVHPAASAMAKKYNDKLLDDPARAHLPTMILGGGSGAGKTFSLNRADTVDLSDYSVIVDTNSDSLDVVRLRYNKIKEKHPDRPVAFNYVERDPIEAFGAGIDPKDKTGSVISRAIRTGRPIPMDLHIKLQDSRQVARDIHKEFAKEIASGDFVLIISSNVTGSQKAINHESTLEDLKIAHDLLLDLDYTQSTPEGKALLRTKLEEVLNEWRKSGRVGQELAADLNFRGQSEAVKKDRELSQETSQEDGLEDSVRPVPRHHNEIIKKMHLDSEGHLDNKKVREEISNEAEYWDEKDIPLDQIKIGDEAIDPSMAKPEKGSIILKADGTIIDGRHRVALARQNGDTTIRAFVPTTQTKGQSSKTQEQGSAGFGVKSVKGKMQPIQLTAEESGQEGGKTIFRPSQYMPKGNVIEYYEDGKRKFIEVENDLYEAMTGMNEVPLSLWVRILSAPAQALRIGATITPDFMMSNFIRDQFTAAIQTDFGFRPFIDSAGAIADVMGKSDVYLEWIRAGGGYSGLVETSRKSVDQAYKELTGRPSLLKKLNIISHLGDFSQVFEEATRVGMFKAAKRKGYSAARAAYESREGTLDFSVRGSTTKEINAAKAFFNAQIRGFDKLVSTFKKNPAGTTVKGLAYITTPTVLLFMINKDDEDYWELPQWRRDLFWNIKAPMPTAIGYAWVSIPKPFGLGQIFGTIPERFMQHAFKDDPSAFDNLIESTYSSISPLASTDVVLPTAFVPVMESFHNKNFFTGRDIVPEYKKDLDPFMQYNKGTSTTAKELGRVLGLSPAHLENTVRGYLGSAGRYTLEGSDFLVNGIKRSNGEDVVEKPTDVTDLPFVRRFIRDDAYGYQSESVRKFFDIADEVGAKHKTLSALKKNKEWDRYNEYREQHQEELSMYKFISRKRRQIVRHGSNIDRIIASDMIDEEKLSQIKNEEIAMTELARQSVDQYESSGEDE